MNRNDSSIQIELTPARLVAAIIFGTLLLLALIFLVRKVLPPGMDSKWSKPTQITHVETAWWSGFSLHRWNGTVVGSREGGQFYLLDSKSNWVETSLPEFDGFTPVAMDARGPNAVFCDLQYSGNKVGSITTLLRAVLPEDGKPRVVGKVAVRRSLEDYFKRNSAEAQGSQELSLYFGAGSVSGSKISLHCFSRNMNLTMANPTKNSIQIIQQSGLTESCLFESVDAGASWQASSFAPSGEEGQVARLATSNRRYLLKTEAPSSLLALSQSASDAGWSQSNLLVNTLKGGFLAETENDTLHLCWMDGRLKKGLGFFIYGDWDVGRKNNLVYYSHRTDKDSRWSKEQKLSGGLSYCEHPTISVEGRRIVAAWHHYVKPYTRAAIYYSTSKDNGRSWTRAKRVNNFESATAESPKVLLHQGIIHLFYDRSGWPNRRCDLMYQRREFPN